MTEVWDDWVTQYTTAPYTVTTEYGAGLEERLYPAMTWVCDQKTVDKETDDMKSGLFWPLFRYIQVQAWHHTLARQKSIYIKL